MYVIDKYRLELRWGKVEYNREDVAVLKQAYFIGPVLLDSAQLLYEDSLVIDMTSQHSLLVEDYYHATLSWKGVQYKRDRIVLTEAWIKGKYVNSIETLENTDWILINCTQHDQKKHPYNLVYFSQVCKEDKERKF